MPTIIEAVRDEHLFRSFLQGRDGSIASWHNWLDALRAVYGLPIKKPKLLKRCTGRDEFPEEGFDTALFLTGRRSGKSRIAAIIGAYEAALAGHEQKLSKGERGIVAIVSPTKKQSRIVKEYIRAIFKTPLLHDEVVQENREGFELRNGVLIEIMAGDFKSIRGFTLLAAVVDEIAFFGLDEEAKIRSDTELVRALKPALATVGGKLLAISSPYAKKGWCYRTWERHRTNTGTTLVVNCPSRTLNPTLPQKVVDEALAEDYAAAQSEYLGHFRDDVGLFISRELVQDLVVPGRIELQPRADTRYFAFADLSGGRVDDAALAIAHREGRNVVIDLLRRYRPPFNPHQIIGHMVDELRRFGIRRITGDNYAAEFVNAAFKSRGISYTKADKPKGQLYIELLPRLTSREIELLDDPTLVKQIAGLERRTRSGGRDLIDHPPGGHDDLANAVAGVAVVAATPTRKIGAM
jgi:hypothetical protein